MGRERTHVVLNVYGEDSAETVTNAIEAAQAEAEAECVSEALREIASAYTGWDAAESQ